MGTAGLGAPTTVERVEELAVAVATAGSSVQIVRPADPAASLNPSAVLASSERHPSSERPLQMEPLEAVVVVHLRRSRTLAQHTCASSCAQFVLDRIHPSLR